MTTAQWGDPSDVPLTGHIGCQSHNAYSIWRPWSGGFWTVGNGPGYVGQPGDIPMLSNFDSVGAPDLVIYRPSTGFWYVKYNAVSC